MNQTDRLAKVAETNRVAQEIIDKERRARDEKTRRLREARLATDQAGRSDS
jgi:hypothetical protein